MDKEFEPCGQSSPEVIQHPQTSEDYTRNVAPFRAAKPDLLRYSRPMLRYLTTRLLYMIPVLWLVVSVVFLLIHLVPGHPIQQLLGEGAAATDVQAARHAYGLDVPLGQQYLNYWDGVLHCAMIKVKLGNGW